MKIAIYLGWIKHNKMGGLESYTRNLLDSFVESNLNFEFVLLLSEDNYDSFCVYERDKRITVIKCPVISENLLKTLIWENTKLDKLVSKLNVDFCFIPYYRQPITFLKNKYIITIHDLIPLHFKQYFSFKKVLFLYFYWWSVIKKSHHIIAISNFQKKDILDNFNCNNDKISVIYNPIVTSHNNIADFEEVRNLYDIQPHKYFYTISSRFKHKNLNTLLKIMKRMKERNIFSDYKLLISGVCAGETTSLSALLKEMDVEDRCVLTGFVSNEIRNCLINNANCFLFPSVFEGFGMPPIEAMMFGTKVITTKCASLPEVTKGMATYVNNPFDPLEWISKIEEIQHIDEFIYDFREYNPHEIVKLYYNVFREKMKCC